jgi:hypothetical protein
MVDIETTGTNYWRNGIIQISAVKFDYGTQQVSPEFFDRCLRLHPGREWDAGTRQWWTKQGTVLQQIEARAEDPYTVVHDFYHWLLKDWPTERPEGLQFWSKPTSFDHPFLTSYLEMFGFQMPCHYRFARDLNSFMAGLSGKPGHPEIPVEPAFVGDSHNALYDVIHQIQMLFAMSNQSTQGVILPPLPAEVAA